MMQYTVFQFFSTDTMKLYLIYLVNRLQKEASRINKFVKKESSNPFENVKFTINIRFPTVKIPLMEHYKAITLRLYDSRTLLCC